MDLSNFEEFESAMERLHRQTEELSRRTKRKHRRNARERKAAGPPSPQELAKLAEELESQSAEVLKLSRAKEALRLRRQKAIARSARLRDTKSAQ